MASVPYSPVPNVTPVVPGAPRIGISTPPQAFGITTAEAEQRLGGQAEQSANEMAETALYVQQLRNETWAKDSFVQNSLPLGNLEEGFRSKRGADAQAAYPQFQKDVMNLYQNAINNAPNPQAARFLGDALSRRITYSIEDAGRHAGEQERQYTETTNINLAAAGQSAVAANPRNDGVFSQAMANTDSAARALTRAAGEGDEGYSRRAEQLKSSLWEVRLHALGSDPSGIKDAIAMFNANKDQIQGITKTGETYQEKIKDWLNRQNMHYGVAQDAQTILEDLDRRNRPDLDESPVNRQDLTPEQRAGTAALPGAIPIESPEFLAAAQQKAREVGKQQPDPNYGPELVNKVTAEYNRSKEAFMLQQNGSFSRLSTAISGLNGQPPITSRADLLSNPLYQDDIDELSRSETGRLKLQRLYGMVDAQGKKGSIQDSIAQQNLVDELRGLAADAEHDPAARDKFFARVGEAYPQIDQGRRNVLSAAMARVQQAWASGRATQEVDPTHLATVMHGLGNFLLANNIDPQAQDGKYYRFQGMVQQQLDSMLARGEQIPTNPAKLQEMFGPLIKNLGLSQDLRASNPPQVQFTGRTISAPGKPTLRETTDGRFVP